MFTISFTALRDLAVRGGIAPRLGWVWAICIDGIIAASTLALVALAKHSTRVKTLPWVLIIAGGAVSVAGNIFDARLHAEPGFASAMVVVISAAPPLGLLSLTQLVVILSRRTPSTSDRRKSSKEPAAIVAQVPRPPDSPYRLELDPDAYPLKAAADSHDPKTSESQPVSDSMKQMAPKLGGYEAARDWAVQKLAKGADPTGTEVADRFGCSPSTARRWLRKIREEHKDSPEERPNSVSRLRAIGS